MKYTANYISENTISTYSHNRQVEIVVSATPVGHVKGWAIVTYTERIAIVSRIDTLPHRFEIDNKGCEKMLSIIRTYVSNKYGLELYIPTDFYYDDNNDMCDIINEAILI